MNNPRGVSPIAGHDGFAMLGMYCATKFAGRALIQSAAREYAGFSITVNADRPGRGVRVMGTNLRG